MTKKIRNAVCAAAVLMLAFTIMLVSFASVAGRKSGREVETVTVKINYYFFDEEREDHKGTMPYPAFVANMTKSSENTIDQKCPSVLGYTPVQLSVDDTTGELIKTPMPVVTVRFDKSYETDIFYIPTDVNYSIELMKQNLLDDDYSLASVIHSKGLTGTIPREFDEDYTFPEDYAGDVSLRGKTLGNALEGFTLMYHQPEVIAADGSTVFQCFYDRNYYSVNFDLGGGYGVSPLYMPYGSELNEMLVGRPEKPGFVFEGWEPALDTVKEDIAYRAKWRLKEGTYYYTLVFKNADLQEEGKPTVYNFWGEMQLEATPDDMLDLQTLMEQYDDGDYYHTLPGNEYFFLDKDMTLSRNTDNLTVRGDNSTIITLYYARKTYKLWFAYARQEILADSFLKADQIHDGDSFYIVGVPHKPQFNPDNLSYAVSSNVLKNYYSNGTHGLGLIDLDGSASEADREKIIRWTFEQVRDDENNPVEHTYYVSFTGEDGVVHYLHIESQNVYYNETPVELHAVCNNDNAWSIWQNNGTQSVYLNDKKDRAACATGYAEPASSINQDGTSKNKGSNWYLYPEKEKALHFGQIEVPTSTGSGQDSGSTIFETNPQTGMTEAFEPVLWTRVEDFPAADASLKIIQFDRYKGDNPQNKRYRYSCVEIEAQYDSDVEALWPTNGQNGLSNCVTAAVYNNDGTIRTPSKRLTFGSWAINFFSPLRTKLREQGNIKYGNIVGAYPILSSDLIMTKETNRTKLPAVLQKSDTLYELIRRGEDYSYENQENDPEIADSLAEIMYAWWGADNERISKHAYEIYYEPLEGEEIPAGTPQETIDGVTYVLDRTSIFTCAHNTTTRLEPFMYKGFEKSIDEALTNSLATADGPTQFRRAKLPADPADTEVLRTTDEELYVTKFHYKRKRSRLTLDNKSSVYAEYADIMYQTPLADKQPSTDPPYPDALPVGAYYFDGKWYTSERCQPGEDVDWATLLMDDQDMVLYAGWQPMAFNVRYFYDESSLQNQTPLEGTPDYHFYGQDINDEQQRIRDSLVGPEYTLADGTVEHARPVGWYYYHQNTLRAFDPVTMQVTGDMDLFMKWSTNVPAFYKVRYMLRDDQTSIASDTQGFSFVGLTRTFGAKVENQLNSGYRECYFPYTVSTSLLLKSDDSQNQATFYYAYRDKVPYRVRYIRLNQDGTEGEPLREDKVVSDNKKAMVTERCVPMEGYIPLTYYVSFTVTISDDDSGADADGVLPQNVITFYYREDTLHRAYHLKYLVEDDTGPYSLRLHLDGEDNDYSFKTINYIDSMAEKGSTVEARVQDFPGYRFVCYDQIISYLNDQGQPQEALLAFIMPESVPQTVVFNMDEEGYAEPYTKELHLHYVKKKYPVKITYSFVSEDPQEVRRWNLALLEKLTEEGTDPGTLQGDPDSAVTVDGEICYKAFSRIVEDCKFETRFTTRTPILSGYPLSGNNEQTIVVADDDGFRKNSISFVYTEREEVMFYYHAVIPDKDDTQVAPADITKLLTLNQETAEVGVAPENAVTAKAESQETMELDGDFVPVYRFEGWYYDRECMKPVEASCLADGDRYTIKYPFGAREDQHFYAKYDYVRGDLTVTAAPSEGAPEELHGQSFEVRIVGVDEGKNDWIDMTIALNGYGSKTIRSLPVGHYRVIQTDWAWRFDTDKPSDTKTVTVLEKTPAKVEFLQKLVRTKWLDGNGYREIIFDE